MADNLSVMLEEFRALTSPDSVSPDSLGFLLQALRNECMKLITDIASGGEVDLTPVFDQIKVIQARLNGFDKKFSEIRTDLSSASNDLGSLSEKVNELITSINKINEYIDNAVINVEAPALLPFYAVVNNVEIKYQSYGGKWRAVYDLASKQFLAQALPDNYIAGWEPNPLECSYYTGNVAIYNYAGHGRSDLIYIKGSNLYAFVGDVLTQLTDNN